MQLSILLSLILTLTTFVSPSPITIKREPTSILNAIAQLSRDVSDLTARITSYTGAKSPTHPFALAFHDIKLLLEDTASEVRTIGSFNYDDSTEISNALQDLAPSVVTLLGELNKKAIVISDSGNTSIVHGALVTLDADTTDLLNALTNAVSISSIGGISTVNAQLSAAFRDAIAVFAVR